MFITNPPVRLWVDFNLVELWGIIQADIWARFLRLIGHQVVHMGLVESQGTWIELKSRELGMTSRELIEGLFALRREDFALFEVGFDGFFTTDSLQHQDLCQSLINVARKNGSVYVREVDKFTCLKCHNFLGTGAMSGNCPNCGAPAYYTYPEIVCSECHGQVRAKELVASPPTRAAVARCHGPLQAVFFCPRDLSSRLKGWVSEPGRFSREVRNESQKSKKDERKRRCQKRGNQGKECQRRNLCFGTL
jgi:methionyl-tRNA synthetase